MHEIVFNQSDSSSKIVFNGSVSIQFAAAIKELFLDALKQSKTILIDHKNAEDFDLTFLQLIFSLNKTAAESGKSVRFIAKHPESFITLIEDSGFPLTNWIVEPVKSDSSGGI